MKKLILVAVILAVVAPVLAQDSLVVCYPAELSKVQKITGPAPFLVGTRVVVLAYASGGQEKAPNGKDPDLCLLRAKAAQQACEDWGLKVVRVEHRLGDDKGNQNSYFGVGKPERGVVLVKAKAVDYGDKIFTLAKALQAEVGHARKADALLWGELKTQRNLLNKIWDYVKARKVTDRSFSAGYEYILIGRSEFSVPVVRLTLNQGFFGLEGSVGGWPAPKIAGEKAGNLAWSGLYFVRPLRFLKLGVGYQGAALFYEADFSWHDRYDCFWLNSELVLPLGKDWNIGLSAGGLKAEEWGTKAGFSITKSF